VSLLPFGTDFLKQALKIEQPSASLNVAASVRARVAKAGRVERPRGLRVLAMGNVFLTIGDFYEAIITGIDPLVAKLGEAAVFPNGGNTTKQVSSLGATPISGSAVAKTQLTNVIEEGEGAAKGLFDETGKVLAHFYVFQEMLLGKSYQAGDKRDHPTGPAIAVPTPDGVFQVMPNPKMTDYPAGSQVATDATTFLNDYTTLIKDLQTAFTTGVLGDAVDDMFNLPSDATKIYADTIPGRLGVVPGPTFEVQF
jgi:hypothetical protein